MIAIKPVLKYPGSKARIAPWITSYFPYHKRYLEPYLLGPMLSSSFASTRDASASNGTCCAILCIRGESFKFFFTHWTLQDDARLLTCLGCYSVGTCHTTKTLAFSPWNELSMTGLALLTSSIEKFNMLNFGCFCRQLNAQLTQVFLIQNLE